MKVRPASSEDFADLTDIWFRAVTATHTFLTDEIIAGYRERIPVDLLPEVPELLVAEEDGSPVGFIGMRGEEVDMLFVDPDRHGRGIGTALIELVARGRDRLEVEVSEQNPDGVAFYLARGFVQTGRSELDPDGRPFPLLKLVRTAACSRS